MRMSPGTSALIILSSFQCAKWHFFVFFTVVALVHLQVLCVCFHGDAF